MKIYFDHEKLNAYQESLRFFAWTEPVLERIPKTLAVHNQLDRARTSVPLNIAEGNGKSSPADRCRFLEIARGSAVECACCLDLLFIKKAISEEELHSGKESLRQVVSMVIGLIQRHQPDRLREESSEYRVPAPPSLLLLLVLLLLL
jgi:four helix bundle protein